MSYVPSSSGVVLLDPLAITGIRQFLTPETFNSSTKKRWDDASAVKASYYTNSYNGTITDTINGYTVPKFEGYNGSYPHNSEYLMGNGAYIFSTTSFTWIAVLKPTANGAYMSPQAVQGDSNNRLLRFGITANKFTLDLRDSAGITLNVTSDSVITDGWNIVACTMNGATKVANIYLKGITNTGTFTGTPFASNLNGADMIGGGSYNATPSWLYDGSIASIANYTTVLTKAQIDGVCSTLANKFDLKWLSIQ